MHQFLNLYFVIMLFFFKFGNCVLCRWLLWGTEPKNYYWWLGMGVVSGYRRSEVKLLHLVLAASTSSAEKPRTSTSPCMYLTAWNSLTFGFSPVVNLQAMILFSITLQYSCAKQSCVGDVSTLLDRLIFADLLTEKPYLWGLNWSKPDLAQFIMAS